MRGGSNIPREDIYVSNFCGVLILIDGSSIFVEEKYCKLYELVFSYHNISPTTHVSIKSIKKQIHFSIQVVTEHYINVKILKVIKQ